jgi:hypothetical protein
MLTIANKKSFCLIALHFVIIVFSVLVARRTYRPINAYSDLCIAVFLCQAITGGLIYYKVISHITRQRHGVTLRPTVLESEVKEVPKERLSHAPAAI